MIFIRNLFVKGTVENLWKTCGKPVENSQESCG